MAAKINGYSDSLANGLQDRIWGKATYSPGTNYYVALFTTTPDSDGTGGTEVTGGAYARVSTTASDWIDAATVLGAVNYSTMSNNTDIEFPTSTASWGTVVGVGIFTAATGGVLLLGGDLTAPKVIDISTVAVFLGAPGGGDLVVNSTNQ